MTTRSAALFHWLLRIYPPRWRERYEQEVAAILEARPLTLRTLVDLILNALDARLDPYFSRERLATMLQRLRSIEITVFRAAIVFLAVGMLFLKLNEYDTPGAGGSFGVKALAPLLSLPPLAIGIGLLVMTLALLIGSAPILWSVLRQAIAGRRWGVLALLAAPILTIMAFAGWAWESAGLFVSATGYEEFEPPETPQSPRDVVLFVSLLALFALGVVICATITPLAARRVNLNERLARFALTPAIVVAAAMFITLLATLTWGLNLALATPGLLIMNGGVFASPTVFSWLVVVILMALATLAAGQAIMRGRGQSAEQNA